MSGFSLSASAIDERALRGELFDPACGGYVCFEGWVRNHNEGQQVTRLEYEAYEPLALSEGDRIIAEARQRFGVQQLRCVHRTGALELGEIAVWVGVAGAHRDEAFRACRYLIDEIKHRLPIWKKEHYLSGDSGWVNCERCAAAASDPHDHGAAHAHGAAPELRRAAPGDRHS